MCCSYFEILASVRLNHKKQRQINTVLLLGTVGGYRGPKIRASPNPLKIFIRVSSNFAGWFSWEKKKKELSFQTC